MTQGDDTFGRLRPHRRLGAQAINPAQMPTTPVAPTEMPKVVPPEKVKPAPKTPENKPVKKKSKPKKPTEKPLEKTKADAKKNSAIRSKTL